MNKDIEDALLAMHTLLKGVQTELEAIGTQYTLSVEETDALHDLAVEVGSAIREIERMVP
jgi:hypothetical protein